MRKLRIVIAGALAAGALVAVMPSPAQACSSEGPVDLCILERPCTIGNDLKPEKLRCDD
ncbi:MAG TPA: hypothetical protein VG318_12170 [Actinomycetota bacterium]|nr:hypothetical protein [Actinomycetota bacterium]